MGQLTIIYAPEEEANRLVCPPEWRVATLPVPEDLHSQDIYDLSRQLAALLLEALTAA